VQGILGTLTIQGGSTVNVDDSGDSTAKTVTISGGAGWDSITGLAGPGAAINCYAGTLNIGLGQGADTVDVLGTGVTTNIQNNGGYDVFNVGSVGNAGSVQGILGTLNIQCLDAVGNNGINTINVNDALDTTAQTLTLSLYNDSNGMPWGSITGLTSGAAINFQEGNYGIDPMPRGGYLGWHADISSVNITTGVADTVNVLATWVPTYLNGKRV
jgi:hypothetical protein